MAVCLVNHWPYIAIISNLAMMHLQFTTTIQAPATQVWHTLWDDASYRLWTAVFCEGSYAVSDWQEGSQIRFLTPDGNGLLSVIEAVTPPRYMAFRHLAAVHQGVDQPSTTESKAWEGAMETYTLTEAEGATLLTAEVDVAESDRAYFSQTFPLALQRVKDIAEGR